MVGFGYNTLFTYGTEGTYGTPVTRNMAIEINGESMAVADDVVDGGSVYRSEMDKDNYKQGRKAVAGNIAFDLRYEGAETLLRHAMGTVTDTAMLGTVAYKHTYYTNDSLPTGITGEIFKDPIAYIYEGAKINSLTISNDNQGIAQVSADFIAEDVGTSATATASSPSTTPYFMFQNLVTVYNGSTLPSTNFSITLNNNLKNDRYQHGSRLIKEPQRAGRIEVTGQIDVEFEGTAQWTQFQSAGTGALTATWTGDNISGTANNEFKITCPFVRLLSDCEPAVSDTGLLMATIPFKAYANGTATTNRVMQIDWTNSLSSVA